MTFGEKIKVLRESKNLKQEEFAKKINVDRSTVGKWENDSSRPDFTKLLKIADYFEVTTDFLLGRTENKKESIFEGERIPSELRELDFQSITIEGSSLGEDDIKELKLFAKFLKANKDKKD